jgi:hypothetical protein
MSASGFRAAALPVLKRLIDPEVVRVTVDVGDRLAKRDHLVAQCVEEIMKAVGAGLRVVFDQGFGVARRRALDLVVVELNPGSA